MKDFGRWIIYCGIGAIMVGFLMNQFPDKFGWIGRLPGDIRVGSENVKFYFPVSTIILFNLILVIIFKIAKWLK